MLSVLVIAAVVLVLVGALLDSTPLALGGVVAALLAQLQTMAEANRNEMEALAEIVKRLARKG